MTTTAASNSHSHAPPRWRLARATFNRRLAQWQMNRAQATMRKARKRMARSDLDY